jgi:hypothetical protein
MSLKGILWLRYAPLMGVSEWQTLHSSWPAVKKFLRMILMPNGRSQERNHEGIQLSSFDGAGQSRLLSDHGSSRDPGEVLKNLPIQSHSDLLVGMETADDVGVFQLIPEIAFIQTLD